MIRKQASLNLQTYPLKKPDPDLGMLVKQCRWCSRYDLKFKPPHLFYNPFVTVGSNVGRLLAPQLDVRDEEVGQHLLDGRDVRAGGGGEGHHPEGALGPRELPGHQAEGVLPLGPVGLVHHEELDVAAGEHAARQVVDHHL